MTMALKRPTAYNEDDGVLSVCLPRSAGWKLRIIARRRPTSARRSIMGDIATRNDITARRRIIRATPIPPHNIAHSAPIWKERRDRPRGARSRGANEFLGGRA